MKSLENQVPTTGSNATLDLSADMAASRQRYITLGMLIVVLGVGGLGTWAAFAPLKSAALAQGVVKVASERKTVQHLEGGIVNEILVSEDQEVAAGQILLRMDGTTARARYDLLRGEHDALTAELSRLEAERDQRSAIVFPEQLRNRRTEVNVARLLAGEEQLFKSRRDATLGQIEVLVQRKQQYQEKIAGLTAQMKSTGIQLDFIAQEIKGAEALLESGMYTKPRYFALKRAEASLEGETGKLRAEIAETQELIGETDLRILDLKKQFQSQTSEKLQETRARLNELGQQLDAAGDILNRTEVVAPQSGRVMGLQVHTRGGVIRPGTAILDIVPKDDKLIVEARVRPEDIDLVHKDLQAEVRFSALNLRTTPVLFGKVTRVSADRFTEPTQGIAFYVAQVEIDPTQLSDLKLYPGMPAEVYILTGERTALDYLFKPILEQVQRGMLEK